MSRILDTLKIRPGEERVSALLIGLMLVASAGGALGSNATEALFFARFGVELLPAMYVLLGLITFVTSMAITVVMGRVAKQRLFILLPFSIAFVLIAERLVIFLNLNWFFAVMWLAMNVIGSLQGLYTWGLAGAACDPRQARRLFPLFGAGGILGTVIGGLVTPPLAAWLHSENLLLVWAGALFAAYGLGRALAGPRRQPPAPASMHAHPPGVIDEMQRGLRFVRRSVVMQWVSYSAVLFSVCYFSLALPFSRGATLQFPDADRLAGFLGLFQSVNTAVALLISLFLANRLFARFGIMPMLLLFPLIYLAGFGVLSLAAPFGLLVGVRFAQMVWMEGVASPAWQALFNIVPPDQRDQVRAFVGGVPEQAGTFIAGLVLMVGEQALQPRQLYWIGLAAAALLVYLIWRAGRAYAGALFDALRAGQFQVFYEEEQPFGGFRTDAAAVSSVLRALDDPDPAARRVAVEILPRLPAPETPGSLTRALADEDGMVRLAALRGLARLRPTAEAPPGVAACLDDPDPEVRWQAVETAGQFSSPPDWLLPRLEDALADSDPSVGLRAAAVLARFGCSPRALDLLHSLAAGPDLTLRIQALHALGECADQTGVDLVLSALESDNPGLRAAACAALGSLRPPAGLERLVAHLDEDEPSARRALAEALGAYGQAAIQPLDQALADPAREDAALLALERVPLPESIAPHIRAVAQAGVLAALRYHHLWQAFDPAQDTLCEDDGRCRLLAETLRDRALHSAIHALRCAGLLHDPGRLATVIDNLRSTDALQRAYALETLDSLEERALLRPLLALWETGEPGETGQAISAEGWLPDLLRDPHPWLRACAALYALRSRREDVRQMLRGLAASDPDFLVRDVARQAFSGDESMQTLPTLSLMERILFLRRVPIFGGLSPEEIKQVAAGMGEAVFSHGDLLAEQGQLGEEMYIIVSGEVRVLLTRNGQKTPDEVARRRAGDFVGEMAIISREPRFATLLADGTVRALFLGQRQFESILRERPEIGLAVMRVLCMRLKEASAGSPA